MLATPDLIDEVQQAVLSYLEEHPSASATLDAIHRWWLLDRMSRLTRVEVDNALSELVANQRIERSVLSDGREIFFRKSLNQCAAQGNRKH